MKWIYIVTILIWGREMNCTEGLKHCSDLHFGNDTVVKYYCKRESAIYEVNRKMWPVSKSIDSIPMTKSNIDSLNNLKP